MNETVIAEIKEILGEELFQERDELEVEKNLDEFVAANERLGDPSGFTISGGSGNDPDCTCCND